MYIYTYIYTYIYIIHIYIYVLFIIAVLSREVVTVIFTQVTQEYSFRKN